LSDNAHTRGGIVIMAVAVVVSAVILGGAIRNIRRGNDTIACSPRSGTRRGEAFA